MKSKLFVLANVTQNVREHLHSFSGIPITNDLGNYLGIPILHKRLSKESCSSLVEKFSSKLAGWKSNFLILAGRITLTKLVLTSLPAYTMSSLNLPESICSKLIRFVDALSGEVPILLEKSIKLLGRRLVVLRFMEVWALNP